MLAEVLIYALSPARLAMHRSGLVRDAVSLWSRARRCRSAWAPHEAHCHRAVERAVAATSGNGCVVVLGSGLMRDVPLDLLVRRFDQVVLVDAVHLLPIWLAVLTWRPVRLVTADLTGRLDGTGPGAVARIAARWRPDLMISANVLSQLPLAAADAEAAGLVADHLAGLRGAGCPVLLLTDLDERRLDGRGRLIETIDLLHGVTLPAADAAWDWLLAPEGEIAGGERLVHRAGSWLMR